jgi:hypothetical protein
MSRTGFLSDENMRKICAEHRPIPINRLDLMPHNQMSTSGIYTRKLKEPKMPPRPSSVDSMTASLMRVSGVDISPEIKKSLQTTFDVDSVVRYYPERQPTMAAAVRPVARATPIWEQIAYNLASSSGSLSSLSGSPGPSPSGSPVPPPSPVSEQERRSPFTAPTPELDPEQEEQERQFRFELERRGRLGIIVGEPEFLPVFRRAIPEGAMRPEPRRPVARIETLQRGSGYRPEPRRGAFSPGVEEAIVSAESVTA